MRRVSKQLNRFNLTPLVSLHEPPVILRKSWETNSVRLLKKRLKACEELIAVLKPKVSLCEAYAEVIPNLLALLKEKTRQVHTHPKTGLLSFEGLKETLRDIHDKLIPEQSYEYAVVTVMFIDIDGFSAFNDRYGHDYGDTVLVAVGKTLAENFKRDYDFVCHKQGDEFVIVTLERGIPFQDVSRWRNEKTRRERRFNQREKTRAERAREAIENLELQKGKVSISVGVFTQLGMPIQFEALWELLLGYMSRADTAMYAAKQAGKNSVTAFIAVQEEGSSG